MPIVTIEITREGSLLGASSVTAEEKAALIKGASELPLNMLHEATLVVIEGENGGCGVCRGPNIGAARDPSSRRAVP
jgi:phenylpyruvate tautomerase PptA (4-oxalocrotonate tautomerase family)